MKKVIAIVLAALMAAPVSFAELSPKEIKQVERQSKNKEKVLSKAGWEIFGTSLSLVDALKKHNTKLAELGEDGMEVYGVSSKSKSKNVGVQMAINNACITYAQQQGSDLRGRMGTEVNANVDNTAEEMDKFYAAYERTVEKEIRGEMQPSYQLIRTSPDGTYEIEVYYIVSESAASKARIRALQNSLQESEAAQKHAEKISEYVQAGFKN